MKSDDYWERLRCDYCGQFIPWKHFEMGKARRELLTPDSEFTAEEYETICAKCQGRIDVATTSTPTSRPHS